METTIEFTPTAAEAVRFGKIVRERRRGVVPLLLLAVGGMQVSNIVLWAVDAGRPGGGHAVPVVLPHVATALLCLGAWVWQFLIARPRRGHVRLRLCDGGIDVAAPSRAFVPWRRIHTVVRLDDALVFDRRFGAPVVVPARAIPGDIDTVWADLDRLLVSTVYLDRGRGSARTITNTAALG